MTTNQRDRLGPVTTALCIAAWLPLGASAVPVDLELVLAVDGSGSVSDSQFDMQLEGLADAVTDPDTVNTVQGGATGSIAPSLVSFSSAILPPTQEAGFTEVRDATSAGSFASDVNDTPRPFGGNRDIDDVIDFAAPLFDANGFDGDREALIIASGGIDDNNLNTVASARDNALSAIDAIDGVAFQGAGAAGSPSGDVEDFLTNTTIGGPGSFALNAGDFGSLAAAVTSAVTQEIQAGAAVAAPAPPTSLLLAVGAAGIGLCYRRRSDRQG